MGSRGAGSGRSSASASQTKFKLTAAQRAENTAEVKSKYIPLLSELSDDNLEREGKRLSWAAKYNEKEMARAIKDLESAKTQKKIDKITGVVKSLVAAADFNKQQKKAYDQFMKKKKKG